MTRPIGREPPLLMNNCQINPDWERWLKLNYPNITDELTNANVILKMLGMRARLDIILKSNWDDYAEETLALLREHPDIWGLIQSIDPPKPTLLQRFIRIFKRG